MNTTTLHLGILHSCEPGAISHLAWTPLATTASAQPSLVNHLARRIGEEFCGRERWEAFEARGPAFEGTVADLVHVIDALS